MRGQHLPIWLIFVFGALLRAQPVPSGIGQQPRQFSLESIRNQCIEFTDVKRGDEPSDFHDCKVSEFGELGIVDEQDYYYALYCLIPSYATGPGRCGDDSFNARFNRDRGLAVFTLDGSSQNARLAFERVSSDIGTLRYEKPKIISSTTGTLLYLPIAVDGTAVGNESEYYLRERGKWEPIEAEEWLKDLQRRIPAGLEIWKGVWPDLETMQAEAGLYRQGDANCCPTGGRALIRLAIRSRKFVLDSVVMDRVREAR